MSNASRAEQAYAQLAEPSCGLDASNRLVFFNSAFSALVLRRSGFHPTHGMSIFDLLDTAHREAWAARIDRALLGEVVREEDDFELRAGEKQVTTMVVVASPFRTDTGEVIGVSLLWVDITEIRVREQELARQKAAAEQAQASTKTFLDGVSHEFRTPLNGLLGNLAVLEGLELSPRAAAPLMDLRTSAARLDELVEEMLSLTGRRAATSLPATSSPLLNASVSEDIVEVRDLVAEELTRMQRVAAQRGLLLEFWTCSPRLQLRGYGRELRQLTRELLASAVAVTVEGHIEVRYGLVWEARGEAHIPHLHLAVEDTRPGSDERQSEASTIEMGLEDSHGQVAGRLLHRTTVGRGATIHADMPVVLANPAEGRPGAALKVLLAEDNHVNARVVMRLLDRANVQVTWVEDGDLAVESMREMTFDLVLMDLQMPRMDGLEATRKIRSELPNSPPIVALTANCTEQDRDACFAAGMNAFIGKPLRPSNLRVLLETLTRSFAP